MCSGKGGIAQQMNYDEDKIDEYTLALLYLVTHERHEGLGARAWKGFDWKFWITYGVLNAGPVSHWNCMRGKWKLAVLF
jgi:hypothetical protein